MLDSHFDAFEDTLKLSLDRTRFLLLGNAFDKFSILLYAQGRSVPYCIAKAAFNASAKAKCDNEYSALTALKAQPIEHIATAVPLGRLHVGDHDFYLQSFVESKLLITELPLYWHRFIDRHFRAAVQHLTAIYRATRAPRSHDDRSFCRCFQHGDFWPGNIGRLDGAIVLYDLEFADDDGLPLFDLLHFGIYYYRVLSNIGTYRVMASGTDIDSPDKDARTTMLLPTDIHTVFCDRNRFSRVMYSAIANYATQCDIDRGDACRLIVDYIERDRRIDGLRHGWKTDVGQNCQLI